MVKGSELVEVGAAIKERIEAVRDVDLEAAGQPAVAPAQFPHFQQHTNDTTLGRVVEQVNEVWKMPRKGEIKGIFLIGGSSEFDFVFSVPCFNLRTQTWSEHPASLRDGLVQHAAVRIGSSVYTIGGWAGEAEAMGNLERLNLAIGNGAWTTCTAAPTVPRSTVLR